MSGIAGIFRRDGTPVGATEIESMLDRVAHRGPDGRSTWCEGALGLGHGMLWTTPESLRERLPLAETDRLAITSDSRIDNRDELAAALGLDANARSAPDSSYILAAFRKWGGDCASRLIGDFAFAIWNATTRELFLARDPMGVRCLYYFASPQLFAFASEIKALFALSEVPRDLDETRVGDYMLNLFEDRSRTFFRNISCLPAGRTFTVTPQQLRSTSYWRWDPRNELRLKSDQEYTDAFRDCFLQAVQCRVRSAFPTGSALSGGLDSSAVACAARRLRSDPIHTFSAIFPGLPDADLKRIDERQWIECVLGQGGFNVHFIHADRLSPMGPGELLHFHLDEPNFAPNLYMHWAMYESARDSGARVFLDGFDGDTTVSYGFDYLTDLARTFRWRKLGDEIETLSRTMLAGMGQWRIFKEFVAKEIAPGWVFALHRLAHAQWREAAANRTLIHRDLVKRLNLRKRARALLPRLPGWRHSAREKQAAIFRSPLFAQTLEMADKASSAFGVEARYPFFDRRLMELCLALPPDQKLGYGWSRLILRRAMDGILPPAIQWRVDKGNLSPNFHRRLLEFEREKLDRVIFQDHRTLEGFVDLSALRAAWRAYSADPMRNPQLSIQIFATANLSLWLQGAGFGRQTAARSNDVCPQANLEIFKERRTTEWQMKSRRKRGPSPGSPSSAVSRP